MAQNSDPDPNSIDARLSTEALNAAMLKVGQRAFQYAAWTRTLLWVWQDGKVVGIDPNDPNVVLPANFERPPPGPPPWIGL
jgi:hypothetical protein